jgi:hypothetical protein
MKVCVFGMLYALLIFWAHPTALDGAHASFSQSTNQGSWPCGFWILELERKRLGGLLPSLPSLAEARETMPTRATGAQRG